jgi:O-6-methylguanine DNA methyltransferase
MTFREEVYRVAKQIPKGKVVTYGQIARLAGKPKAARAVGMFMRTNSFAPAVPCHRVVGCDGRLVGFSAGKGIETKKEMLNSEGVYFKNDKADLEKSLWNK